jgi:hypothetical protein
VRVDVTADRGKTWHVAYFTGQDTKSKPPRHWAWTLWEAEIPIPPGEKQVQDTYMKSVNAAYLQVYVTGILMFVFPALS